MSAQDQHIAEGQNNCPTACEYEPAIKFPSRVCYKLHAGRLQRPYCFQVPLAALLQEGKRSVVLVVVNNQLILQVVGRHVRVRLHLQKSIKYRVAVLALALVINDMAAL